MINYWARTDGNSQNEQYYNLLTVKNFDSSRTKQICYSARVDDIVAVSEKHRDSLNDKNIDLTPCRNIFS